jgi:hypothetical protein
MGPSAYCWVLWHKRLYRKLYFPLKVVLTCWSGPMECGRHWVNTFHVKVYWNLTGSPWRLSREILDFSMEHQFRFRIVCLESYPSLRLCAIQWFLPLALCKIIWRACKTPLEWLSQYMRPGSRHQDFLHNVLGSSECTVRIETQLFTIALLNLQCASHLGDHPRMQVLIQLICTGAWECIVNKCQVTLLLLAHSPTLWVVRIQSPPKGFWEHNH